MASRSEKFGEMIAIVLVFDEEKEETIHTHWPAMYLTKSGVIVMLGCLL